MAMAQSVIMAPDAEAQIKDVFTRGIMETHHGLSGTTHHARTSLKHYSTSTRHAILLKHTYRFKITYMAEINMTRDGLNKWFTVIKVMKIHMDALNLAQNQEQNAELARVRHSSSVLNLVFVSILT